MHPQDLKYAVRRLARSPGFTLVAVLSLALGIGANTAMFSLVNAVLLRDLPVEAPEELVEVYTSEQDGYEYATSSQPDYQDLKARGEVFSGVVGTRTFIARLDQGGAPEVVFGELVSWDYFKVLGVPMAQGRYFLPEEDATIGTHPVAILGHQTWTQTFGSDPAVLGQDVYLNGRPYTVVGVAPEAFTGSMPVMVSSFFVPLMMTDELMGLSSSQIERRSSRSMFLKARLKPGVTVEQANASLAAFSAGLAEAYPDTNEDRVMSALANGDVALHPLVDNALVPVAGLLLTVVGVVLLIACANLASFLLARAEDRRKEIAVRLALGARRSALIRQLMVETTLLAALGGVAGFVLANWTLQLLMSFQPPLPVPVNFDVSLDRTVLFFTAGVSLLAGLLFGLAPALQATNPDVAPTLKNEGTGGGRPRRFNLRNGLVVTQVAFSFVLLIGAGLFVRSLQKAQLIDPGFDTGPAAMIWPMPELSGYETSEDIRIFTETFEQRLLAHPSITAVAQTDVVPLGMGVQTQSFIVPGVPSETPDGDHDIDNSTINYGYFDAMGVDVVRGRSFQAGDAQGDPVVIVSQAFVDRFYPGEDVVGRPLETPGGSELRILGVAADAKVRTLGEVPRPFVYKLQGQIENVFFSGQFVVRGSATGLELLEAAQGVLDEVDPNMVIMEAKTMNDHLAIMLFPPRMAAMLLSVFGGLALLLSAIGIYGVVSYSVAKRTRELGIRMSLGANRGDVIRMAVGSGMRLVVVGAVLGVGLAGAGTWALKGFLYGIGTTDLATFAAIPVVLMAVALTAAWIPARRASSVDPVTALRSE
jgi:predicted permease